MEFEKNIKIASVVVCDSDFLIKNGKSGDVSVAAKMDKLHLK